MISRSQTRARESPIVYESVEGVNIAVDRVYDVYVDGRYEGSLVAMPTMIEEAALGYAITRGYPAKEARITVVEDRINIELRGSSTSRNKRAMFPGECGQPAQAPTQDAREAPRVDWNIIMGIIRDFADKTASRRYRIAAHTVAYYTPTGILEALVHDTSRHTAMLKLLGLKVKGEIKQGPGIVASTGRASADIVYATSLAGASVLITLRGPLASGYKAARKLGIMLVANTRTRDGREFRILTGNMVIVDR
ncbi:MAG: formate dehydrogenase accessory sulfurtransferase FdhD [Desulfurococcales archaeon]|nr:formate dehydrogenase accessory sulfurtransferase FdhD [Desulfurococcales archaeon]